MSNPSSLKKNIQKTTKFYLIGLSYKKADAEIRGHFSLPETTQQRMLEEASVTGIEALSIVSTCNRTELYGFAEHPYHLIKLLCKYTPGTMEELEEVVYVLREEEAVAHLFRVATGLDSQILGDFEIIGQLKKGLRRSKEMGLLNAYMERLGNSFIQASKRIKNETSLSSGATSVSFAAVQYILSTIPAISQKNILLFGLGKIGKNTCENLVKHSDNKHLTLINRTRTRAEKIGGKFNLKVKDHSQLNNELKRTDVVVVATGAQEPTITPEMLQIEKPLLILDLSIPKNVDPAVSHNPLVTLVHLDQLTRMTDETLEARRTQVPAALAIIDEIQGEFITWAKNRKFAPTIRALKDKLSEIKQGEIDYQQKKHPNFNREQAEVLSDRLIHKITTHFANHLKNAADNSDDSIELIRQVFELANRQA
jgi:glutamyl-tRNA reductase